MKQSKTKKQNCIIILTSIELILTATVATFLPLDERKVYTELIRLHILPNSPSEEDMEIKYIIRDAVISESEKIFAEYKNSYDAKAEMEVSGKKIENLANSILEQKGKSYKAKAVFGKESYPEREYEGFSLPAGEYYSLRILLGEGVGDNWWCVLFPPLCLGASKVEYELSVIGIDKKSSKTFTEKKPEYRIKFKLLEWIFG
jgi:stage II sporulation protein R